MCQTDRLGLLRAPQTPLARAETAALGPADWRVINSNFNGLGDIDKAV